MSTSWTTAPPGIVVSSQLRVGAPEMNERPNPAASWCCFSLFLHGEQRDVHREAAIHTGVRTENHRLIGLRHAFTHREVQRGEQPAGIRERGRLELIQNRLTTQVALL